jgi:hypothetical protein
LPVSIGCSVAFSEAPRARTARTIVLQIPDAAGQPVDPGVHEDVALPEEVEDGPEFLPALGGGAGSLLGLDRVAPFALKAVIWISRS